MDEDNSQASDIAEASTITSRRDVRVGTRTFEVDIAAVANGRITLTVVGRDSTGAVRSEIDATIATDDLNLLAQVLGAELKTLAAWQKRPRQSYADIIEQARRVHGNAYPPWSAAEEQQLVAQFRTSVTIPQLSTELGRSAGAIRGRLEQLGEIAPVRGDLPTRT
jgi:hypothetical protein